MYTTIDKCLVCDGGPLELILDLGQHPSVNRFAEVGQSEPDPVFPLEFMRCSACGHCQLSCSVDPGFLFSDYSYVSGTTAALVSHAETILGFQKLFFDDLNECRLLEVGSNDGSLLKLLSDHFNSVVGVDPAENLARYANDNGVDTECAFFGSQFAKDFVAARGHYDVIIARHVFAHVPSPFDFLIAAKECLAPEGLIELEFPDLMSTYRNVAFDMIYHEHMNYFAVSALKMLAERADLKVVHVEEVDMHGGSVIVFLAHAEASRKPTEQLASFLDREEGQQVLSLKSATAFARESEASIQASRGFFEQIAGRGETIWGYGASAKAQVQLNTVLTSDTNVVSLLFDKSPYKIGRLTPGLRIPVVSPDDFSGYEEGQDIIIFPWNLKAEIISQLADKISPSTKYFVLTPSPQGVSDG